MKRNYLPLVLTLFVCFSAYAQTNSFTIKGQVVDSLTSESVPYATLKIVFANTPQQTVKLLACDDDGQFETSLNTPGQYIISMQSIGKVASEKRFTLPEDSQTFDLGKLYMTDDNQRLGEVTITAQKPLVKVEIDKISYSLEDDPEAQTNNTLEMLRKVPMVTVDGEDKIQLKGSTNFKIYLNGKPSNMLSENSASDVLKSMPASSVKNIEVITDPGAKYDAEGVGGIINIITSRNALQGYNATIRADVSTLGQYSGGGYITTKIGALGLTANYNYMQNDRPWGKSEYERSTFGENPSRLTQYGRSKNTGPGMYGSLEASYEIDTLNLITLGANLFNGKSKNRSEYDVLLTEEKGAGYSYNRYSHSSMNYGGLDLNLDYQRSTRKKMNYSPYPTALAIRPTTMSRKRIWKT
ncbi:hypothetical protein M2135_003080 [Parabacteroides sp. PF5-9]|nr:hypothetical protein [Parabacteroides sp. PF5-9]